MRKILCVDDDVEDLFFLSDAIHQFNPSFQIVEKSNGVEALSYLTEAKQNNDLPCLVVLDINMPLLDGKETLEKIRRELFLEGLPVVVFTSSQNPNDRKLFQNKGVEMYTKPLNLDDMRNTVRTFLDICE